MTIMNDKSVDIDIHTPLEETILQLDEDNQKILEKLVEIRKIIEDIDETKYSAPEKKKIEDELYPYLEKKEVSIFNNLNNCNSLLKKAYGRYFKTDTALTKSTNSEEV